MSEIRELNFHEIYAVSGGDNDDESFGHNNGTNIGTNIGTNNGTDNDSDSDNESSDKKINLTGSRYNHTTYGQEFNPAIL